jgi:hypothetical protein
MRVTVSEAMFECPLNARETVEWETPATFAISLIVTASSIILYAHVCIKVFYLFSPKKSSSLSANISNVPL